MDFINPTNMIIIIKFGLIINLLDASLDAIDPIQYTYALNFL